MAQQNKKQKCKGCKDGGIYQKPVTNTLVGLILVIFPVPQSSVPPSPFQEIEIDLQKTLSGIISLSRCSIQFQKKK